MADSRFLLITSPVGAGALIATRLTVKEQLGLPYSIEVDVLGSDVELNASALLTKEITVTVSQTVDDQLIERPFHGLVAGFERLGPGAGGRMGYRLVAVPGLWRLGLKRNCRVFQNKTVQQIVTAVLGEHEQPAPSWGILPALQPMVYCTQFNETDLHFISRLLEEHGMTYYFTHTATSHTLCISATAPGFPAHVGGDVVAVHESDLFFQLVAWRRANRVRPAATQFEDMDGERSQPSVVLKKSSDTHVYADEPAMWAAGKNYRWPGGMSTRPGVDSAAVVMGELETASEEYMAEARDPRFVAGARVAVAVRAEDASEVKQQYVVTTVRHEATDTSGIRSGAGAVETYQGSLALVAVGRTWMPAQRHGRPVMAGLYSAKVMGPPGEKIHVDEFGRIKIKFRWDRLGPDNDTASCWVRVMQAAGGAWGGTWFLPRVGDEVLVAFLDGDPDRPVVTGAVYGKDAKPPFQPGVNRSQSGFRSRSYKSESADDSNILRFEDKAGSEEVLVHAQKDLTVEVENDENRTVGHDSTETVKNARTATINDSHDTLTVEKGNRTATIKVGNDTLMVEQGNRTATVKMGNDTHTIKMGDMTVKCELGSITLEAMQKITLKVGQNTVVIDQTGITAKGIMISDEAKAMHKTKAPLVQVNGDAMVQVQGGIVMIN
jgi:type VI secretion system secreted protein VgrG